jgi:hypothetical protein
MSYPPFDPQKVIERFQAGEWLNNPDYWAVYRNIWQKQNAIIQLAEKLRGSKAWDTPYNRAKNPDFKLEAATLEKEHFKALYDYETAAPYYKRFLKAIKLLKKGDPKWHFTLPALIKLGVIHLRENHQKSEVNTTLLRNLIKGWQEKNGQRSAFYDNQWYRTLKLPEIVKLLAL